MILRRHMFGPRRRQRHDGSQLLALLAFLLTGHSVNAQGRGGNNQQTTTSNTPQQTIVDDPEPTPAQTGDSNNDNNANASQQPTSSSNTKSAKASSTTSATLPNVFSTSTSSAKLPGITSSQAPLPNLSSALPKLTQNTAGLPTYQVVIPELNGNPYLETSSFPQGTVFIVVGSCLAGLALMLIFSRAIYIWCLHRQTKKQSKDVKYSEMEKGPYTGATMSSNPFAGMSAGGNISLDYLRPGDRSSRVSTFSSRPSTARPQTRNSTLRPNSTVRPNSSVNPLGNANVQFYSPSAHPVGVASGLGTQAGSRDSGYLPAGYYLREPSAPNNMRDPSPRQMYAAPTQNTTSFLYTDPSAPPVPRLTRSPTGNSTNTVGSNTRPSTGGGMPPSNGGGYAYTSQTYNSQARRAPSSYGGDPAGGDRRSKPSQVLDEMLRL
jgi:hypothetical protein